MTAPAQPVLATRIRACAIPAILVLVGIVVVLAVLILLTEDSSVAPGMFTRVYGPA